VNTKAKSAAKRQFGLYCETAFLPQGWCSGVRLEASSGRFTAVEIDATRRPGDQPVAIALPGVGNLHSHAFQRGLAGLAEQRGPTGDNFWTWRAAMYRFVARLDPEDVEAIAALAYAEMLEAGFTRVAEFQYLHHDRDGKPFAAPAEMSGRIAAAAAQTGIGLTLLPVFYAQGGFGGLPADDAQARFVTDPDSYACLIDACRAVVRALPDALVGIAPHSLRAATPEQLRLILPLARDGPIHIHIAEQTREVAECLAWSGARPVAWLLDHCPVDRRWCLVHATHLVPVEINALAASGATAGLCPITEANLGDGLFPLDAFQRAGGCFGIGTDSNILISLTEELRLLEYGQRLKFEARNVGAFASGSATGRTLFEAALVGGARALGKATGLAVGCAADVVCLDADHPSLLSRLRDSLLDSLIFAGSVGAIASVWRAGRQVVRDGRHVERPAIMAAYRASLGKLLA